MNELKPCPFCGGKAEYSERGNEIIGIKETKISCKGCGTTQTHKWLRMKHEFEKIRNITIEAWNRRVSE